MIRDTRRNHPCACECGRTVENRFAKYHPDCRGSAVSKSQSAAQKANHPSRKHPEIWIAQAERMRQSVRRGTSKLEERVAEMLGEGWTRQKRIGRQRLDFYSEQLNLAVEVNGCWHHSCPRCHPGGPAFPLQLRVRGYDNRKRQFCEREGIMVLYLWECDQASWRMQTTAFVDFFGKAEF